MSQAFKARLKHVGIQSCFGPAMTDEGSAPVSERVFPSCNPHPHHHPVFRGRA